MTPLLIHKKAFGLAARQIGVPFSDEIFEQFIEGCTLKEASSRYLENYHLGGVFEFLLTAEDCQKGKPDPEIYNLVLAKLRLSPGEVLAIEDSPVGVEAAKAAGIKCLVVTRTHSEEEGEPCLVI